MKTTQFLFYLLLLIGALNTTHNAVYNQCILYINQDLLGSQYQLKLTLSVYFCAIFFVRCLVGTVADRYSAKKCLFIALCVALIGHILACISTNMPMFIVARFIQGLGLGGGQVLGLVILMQLFTFKGRASIIATEQVFFSLASICLPLMGHAFSTCLSWRLIYTTYIGIALFSLLYFLIFQPKEATVELPSAINRTPTSSTQKSLFSNWQFIIPTFMACFSISSYILWGSYFSLLVHHYNIDLRYLLMYQLLPIIPYFTCSLLFKKWTTYLSQKQIYKRIFFCQLCAFLGIILLFCWNKTSTSFKFLLLIPILLHNVAGSFFRPLMQEKALNAVPNNRIGTASSFISICQVGVNAFFSIVINCTTCFLPTFVSIQSFIMLITVLYAFKQYIFYRKPKIQDLKLAR